MKFTPFVSDHAPFFLGQIAKLSSNMNGEQHNTRMSRLVNWIIYTLKVVLKMLIVYQN